MNDGSDEGIRSDARAKKAAKPAAETRTDSVGLAPINGFGEPFEIALAPGWRACWVSDKDLERLTHREWEVATWEDPRVIEYRGAKRPKDGKGVAIRFNELTCYLVSEEAYLRTHAHDPRRLDHRQRRAALMKRAEESDNGAGQRGIARMDSYAV